MNTAPQPIQKGLTKMFLELVRDMGGTIDARRVGVVESRRYEHKVIPGVPLNGGRFALTVGDFAFLRIGEDPLWHFNPLDGVGEYEMDAMTQEGVVRPVAYEMLIARVTLDGQDVDYNLLPYVVGATRPRASA